MLLYLKLVTGCISHVLLRLQLWQLWKCLLIYIVEVGIRLRSLFAPVLSHVKSCWFSVLLYFNSFSRLKCVGGWKPYPVFTAVSGSSSLPHIYNHTHRLETGQSMVLLPSAPLLLIVAHGCQGRAACWVTQSRSIDDGEPWSEHQPHTHKDVRCLSQDSIVWFQLSTQATAPRHKCTQK